MTSLFAITPMDSGVVSLRIATDDACYMNAGWAERLVESLGAIGRDADVRAVVLEGGARVFCAGASREALLGMREQASSATAYAAQVARALLALPVPAVAAAGGHAIGGGLLLGLWCDAILLGEESLYGANFMALGFTPGMGATVAVPDALGPSLGRQVLFTGELLTGRAIRDARCPLSHAVVPRAKVRDRALAVARGMAEAPREALVLLKEMIVACRLAALERAVDAEERSHVRLFRDEQVFNEIARRYAQLDDAAGQR